MKLTSYKSKHIFPITKPDHADKFPFTLDSILKFIQDLIIIFIPIFKNKDPESPPVSGGSSGGSSSGGSSGS